MKHRFLLLVLCACVLACDSASPVAPSGTVLSVNANPTKISLSGDPSTITVTGFKPDGNPLNPGTQILVSTDVGNLYTAATGGNLVSSLEIGSGGRATVYLRGDGRPGSATVTATLTTGGEASATATVQVGETTDSRPTLTLSANPSIVDVTDVSRIDILARNIDNTPLASGRVRLTADLGTLHETEQDAERETGEISSVNIDPGDNGEAVVYFRAGSQSGTGAVRAIVGTSEEVSVPLDIRDVVTSFSFSVTGDVDMPIAGGSLDMEAIVTNARNEGVRNIVVRFSASDGVGGTYTPATAVATDAAGFATTTLTLTAADVAAIPSSSFQVSATVSIDGEDSSKSRTITIQQN